MAERRHFEFSVSNKLRQFYRRNGKVDFARSTGVISCSNGDKKKYQGITTKRKATKLHRQKIKKTRPFPALSDRTFRLKCHICSNNVRFGTRFCAVGRSARHRGHGTVEVVADPGGEAGFLASTPCQHSAQIECPQQGRTSGF